MSIKTDFESPVVLICVQINYYLHPAILSECLNNHLIDNNLNELNSIDFIIPRPGRSGTISCVRFVMVVMVVKVGSQLDKNIPYDY